MSASILYSDRNKGPWGTHNPPPRGGGNSGGNKGGGGGKEPPDIDLDEMFKKGRETIENIFGNSGDGGGKRKGSNKKTLLIVALLGIILWLSSGIYKVDASEVGVVMRFGAFHSVKEEGLNYHFPSPIEKVIILPATIVNEVEVGARSSRGKRSTVTQESLMLTGDENIVDIDFILQWRIGTEDENAANFLFNIKGQADTVKSVAESAMREVVGRRPIDDALTDGRNEIEDEAKQIIQEMLDSYGAGIEIIRLQIGKAQVPKPVLDAFRDVQAARADMERAKNEAEAYRNDIIPRARGEAQKVLQQAQAYKQGIVAKAQGEAKRFVAVYDEYRRAKDITKKRIYLETMQDVLQGTEKILLDSGAQGSGVVPYLPLPEVRKRAVGQ